MNELYIGLMSGTSLDGIDAVLVDFSQDPPRLIDSHAQAIPNVLKTQIQQLCDATLPANEINQMGAVDRQIGLLFAQAVLTLCKHSGVNPKNIRAIGSHGQTIRHYPNGHGQLEQGFTVQIGDANTIAVQTGIDVIADFRKKDVALGGQGAPLVPAFHQYVFGDKSSDRMIVNIGGMANLTFLPAQTGLEVTGYDIGPGNTLLDGWCMRHTNQTYDKDGNWGRSGELNQVLLQRLLADEYFAQPSPKSTGREKFNLAWLEAILGEQSIAVQDVQATLVNLTALSIADEIKQITNKGDVYLCGGGSRNSYLVETIAFYLGEFEVMNTDALGVDPDWLEAIAFAWLARAYVLKQPGNMPSVTGASRAAVLGCYIPFA
jgi:anhydro-N-acetylmuramic acid kinase